MDNDNKPNLRVVNSMVELSEREREMLVMLREAISHVERGEVGSIAVSLILKEGDVLNMASSSEQVHSMVAATVYQLFDLISAGTRVK